MIPADVRIFIATAPVDMRRSFDGLASIVKEALGRDPLAQGVLVVFFNKKRTHLKLFWHDRTGHCLLYKRMDRGLFRLPELIPENATSVPIDARELASILEGVPLPQRRETAREVARAARSFALSRGSTSGTHAVP